MLGTEHATEKGPRDDDARPGRAPPRWMSDEPSYEAGYSAGLAGMPTPRHFDVLLEQVLWADGWHAGMAEAARLTVTTQSHLG